MYSANVRPTPFLFPFKIKSNYFERPNSRQSQGLSVHGGLVWLLLRRGSREQRGRMLSRSLSR